ncbi:E3 ubiquitin-protein ligase MARCH3 [Trichinella spiralis]|uniref:E3 ubiquitin-protein ligase MARCH3 n=1 Tax=Trichinella spiralis TaxID=6334 RepID=A0A0V1BED2_TRISP|nr:E3 ubiquitin-protein ligase MARCH3 [Trichinella spiralis]
MSTLTSSRIHTTAIKRSFNCIASKYSNGHTDDMEFINGQTGQPLHEHPRPHIMDENREKAYRLVAYTSVLFSVLAVSTIGTTYPAMYTYIYNSQQKFNKESMWCQESNEIILNHIRKLRTFTSALNRTARHTYGAAVPSWGESAFTGGAQYGPSRCCRRGFPGRPGIPGRNGENGRPGMPGAPGMPGISQKSCEAKVELPCPQCPAGPPGAPGSVGLPGDVGRIGDPGRDGVDGIPGRAGIDGKEGMPGVPGLDGQPGEPGRPAPYLPISHGECGEPGMPGPSGPAGPPGVSGNDGIQGPMGPKGVKGPLGPPGLPGNIGFTGPQGMMGPPGQPGLCATYCANDGGVFHDPSAPAPYGPVCRICHGSELSSPTKGEPLLSLCKCRGTMGLFHPSCLETWLSISNTDKCEICHYQFATERHPKCVTQFIKSPGSPLIMRNMISDFMCFLILTPLAILSIWLCISGALYYGNYSATAVEVTLRYHCQIYYSWQEKNQNVKVHFVRKFAPSSPLLPSAEILSSNSVGHDVNNNFIYSDLALQNSV